MKLTKIRFEVEADAEVIIGAITDPSLEENKSINRCTSLDGQQPETKSSLWFRIKIEILSTWIFQMIHNIV